MKTDKMANKKGTERERDKSWSLYSAHENALKRLWDRLEKSKGKRRQELMPVMERAIWRLADIDMKIARYKAKSYASNASSLKQRYVRELSEVVHGACRYYPSDEVIKREKRIKEENPKAARAFEEIAQYFNELAFSVDCTHVRKLAANDRVQALKEASSVSRQLFSEIFDQVAQDDPTVAFKVAESIVRASSVSSVFSKLIGLAAQRPDLMKEDRPSRLEPL